MVGTAPNAANGENGASEEVEKIDGKRECTEGNVKGASVGIVDAGVGAVGR